MLRPVPIVLVRHGALSAAAHFSISAACLPDSAGRVRNRARGANGGAAESRSEDRATALAPELHGERNAVFRLPARTRKLDQQPAPGARRDGGEDRRFV